MHTLKFTVLTLLLATYSVTWAEDAEEDTGPWSGAIAAGYLGTSGNTDSTSANFDLEVIYSSGPWAHALTGRAFGASNSEATTAEAYSAGWKTTYDFDERNYTFGALDWNKDRFAGFTRQAFATAGYGRRILTGEEFILNAEVGAGYAKQWPSVGEQQTGAVGTLSGDFVWNFSEGASFGQTLGIFATSDNTYWESVTSLSSNLVGNLALALSYTLRQNSDVPAGTKKTDKLTAISLAYGF